MECLTYLAEVLKEVGLETHTAELLGKELALYCLILVFRNLVGIFQVDLLDQLSDQVLVEVCTEFFGELLQTAVNIVQEVSWSLFFS